MCNHSFVRSNEGVSKEKGNDQKERKGKKIKEKKGEEERERERESERERGRGRKIDREREKIYNASERERGRGETERKRNKKSEFVKSPAYTFVAGTQIAWQQHSLNHFLPSLSFPSLLWHTCPFLPLVNSPLERFRGTCRCAPTREISQGPPANDEKKAPLTIQGRTQGMLPDALTFHKIAITARACFFFFFFFFFLSFSSFSSCGASWFFRLVAHRQSRVVSNFYGN